MSSSQPTGSSSLSLSTRLAASTSSPAIIRRLDKSFGEQLSIEDRRRLRAIVRRTHRFLFGQDSSTKHEDQVIDALGPEAARKMLFRALADGKVG